MRSKTCILVAALAAVAVHAAPNARIGWSAPGHEIVAGLATQARACASCVCLCVSACVFVCLFVCLFKFGCARAQCVLRALRWQLQLGVVYFWRGAAAYPNASLGVAARAPAPQGLTSDAANAIAGILTGSETLISVAPWADTVRSQAAYKWSAPLHFINTPDWACACERCARLAFRANKL